MPFKAKNNREAVVVCAIHVVKRPSKRSVLVYFNMEPIPNFVKTIIKLTIFSFLLYRCCMNHITNYTRYFP